MIRPAAAALVVLAACGGVRPDAPGERVKQALEVRRVEQSPPAGQAGARFGQSVVMLVRADGGASYAVGAPGQVGGFGAVHVYARVDGTTGGAEGGTSIFGLGKGVRPAQFGYSLASGDLDRDGLPDLVMGAPGYAEEDGGSDEGSVWLFRGVSDPAVLGTGVPLPNPRAANLRSGSRFGEAVHVTRDWDGDGRPDLVVAAPGANRIYVYRGSAALLVEPVPVQTFISVGTAIASPDVDGDDKPDLLLGDPLRIGGAMGTGDVELKRRGGGDAVLRGSGGLESFGAALLRLGDVTADGVEDVAVGAPALDAGSGGEGAVIIYRGDPNAQPPVGFERRISSPARFTAFGAALASPGDFDGDGTPDLLIGAPKGLAAGGALLYSLGPLQNGGVLTPLTTFAEDAGPGSEAGAAVAGGGDLDGDGYPDLLVGAPGYSTLFDQQLGRVFIYFGLPGDGGRNVIVVDAGVSLDAGNPGIDAGLPEVPDSGVAPLDAGTVPLPDGGTPPTGRGQLSFGTRGCACGAGGPLVLLLPLVWALRRRRDGLRSAPLVLVALLAVPAAENAWETVASGAITVKARARPDSAIFEIWAEADLDAPVRDLQDTLTTMERFPKFMPYVKAAKEVEKEEDGGVFTYTELGLPVISDRDYVVHVVLDEGVNPDGTGTYRCRWAAVPDKLPERSGLVRVKVNEGSWVVTPNEDGKSHVVYKFIADPGGMLPAWAANYGNRRGVSGALEAIEKEAQRRQKERAGKP